MLRSSKHPGQRKSFVWIAPLLLMIAFILGSIPVSAEDPPEDKKDDKRPAAMNCSDGELRVGDLKGMDDLWKQQQPQLDAIAKAWEADAVLTGLRVSCGILETGFRWQGTYYSATSQAFLATDTGETIGAEFDPSEAAPLPEDITFGSVWRTLAKAGYDDSITLNPAIGISLQVNSAKMPLGPDTVPVGALICHVALEYLGEVRDLFVSVPDGTIYRHAFP
ncbi:hypothetical protein BH09CHL1_BH09CHL1_30850 [soil metagenome]